MELTFINKKDFKAAVTYLEAKYCYTQYNDELTLRFHLVSQAESAYKTCIDFLKITPSIQYILI